MVFQNGNQIYYFAKMVTVKNAVKKNVNND
jgi:hypothetical protein